MAGNFPRALLSIPDISLQPTCVVPCSIKQTGPRNKTASTLMAMKMPEWLASDSLVHIPSLGNDFGLSIAPRILAKTDALFHLVTLNLY
jgi:hypothetical protein